MSKFIKHEKGFFDQLIIKKLRSLPNGGDCVIIYQKILELALDTEGILTFSDISGSIEDEFSLELNENIDNVKNVFNFLIHSNLIIKKDQCSFILVNFEDFVNAFRNKLIKNYMKNYRKKKAAQNGVITRNNSVITKNYSVITNDKKQQPSEPSQTRATSAKAKKETAQNEQVSTNTRTRVRLDINNNTRNLNKDLNIKLKDKQDLNNKYLELDNLELENKDLDLNNKDFKELKTKDLKTKSLNNKNINARTREDDSQELVVKDNNYAENLQDKKDLTPKEPLTVSKDSNNSSADLQALTKQVIEHINCVAHANYRNLEQYRDLIQDCLNDGYTPQDFITAIYKKTADLASNPDLNFWLNRCIKPTWILKPENLDQCLNLRIVPKVDKATYDCLKRRSDVRKVLDNIDVQFDPDDDNKPDIVDDFDNFFDIKFDEERVCA